MIADIIGSNIYTLRYYHKTPNGQTLSRQQSTKRPVISVTSLNRLPPITNKIQVSIDKNSHRQSTESLEFNSHITPDSFFSGNNSPQIKYLNQSRLYGLPTSDEIISPQDIRKRNSMLEDKKSQFQENQFKLQFSETSSNEGQTQTHTKPFYSPRQITCDQQLPPIKILERTIEGPYESEDVSPFNPVKLMKTHSWRVAKLKLNPLKRTPATNNNESILLPYHPSSMMEALYSLNQSPTRLLENSPLKLNEDDLASESGSEEFNIYEQEPLKQDDKKDKVIHYLELLKYRFETYEQNKEQRQPISCNDIVKLSQQHAKKHKKSWLRWFAGKKIKWIDFRDFTQF